MKPVLFLAILITFLGVVSATDFNLVSPWGNTTWYSGGDGLVKWTVIKGDASAPDVKQCNLDLMQGNFTNANVVAHIAVNLDVNMGQYTWKNVPDYKAGSDYFVRVGTSAWYRYGHSFTFVGKGSVQSLAIPAPSSDKFAAASGPDNSTSSSDTSSATSSDTSSASTKSTTNASNSSASANAPGSSSSSVSSSSKPSANDKSSAGFNNQANVVLLAFSLVIFAFCTL